LDAVLPLEDLEQGAQTPGFTVLIYKMGVMMVTSSEGCCEISRQKLFTTMS
jgi:hypothetical protein